LPAVALPARDPAIDAVLDVLAVGMQLHLARTLEGVERLDGRRQLHLVVGGLRRPAAHFLVVPVIFEDRAPASGAGIARTGAVGKNQNAVAHCAAASSSWRRTRGMLKAIVSCAVTATSTLTA